MKYLEQKYRRDELSPQELKTLRETLQSMSEEQIGQTMRDSWMDGDTDTSDVDNTRMDKLKQRIDRQLNFRPAPRVVLVRALRAAAAVLLLLFISTTIYFYRENKQLESEDMLISTAKGERANITLPDGTKVTLNAESNLAYTPKLYNKNERQIRLDGEAFLQVKHDKARPFRIDAKGLYVNVLGTTFNLLVRDGNPTAELTLEKGHVRFASVLSGKYVVLDPNQKAILCQSNGEITVMKEMDIQQATAWTRGELVFRNTPLADVLHTVCETYGVSIETDSQEYMTDLFTGAIPAANLNEVLDILEKTYRFRATLRNSKVQLVSRK